MKAALIYSPGDVRIEEVPDPVITEDEVLVKVHACGVCGTDVHYFRAGDPSMLKKPLLSGHEFSGEIVEIGSAIRGLRIGERVVGTGLRDCRECYWCRNQLGFCPNPKVPGEGLDGAFAEYVVIPNPMLGTLFFRIPDGFSWEKAATIEPMSVSCYAVEQSGLREEEIVMVMGAGVIGLGIIQACKVMNPYQIIVSEPSAMRRDMASEMGADVVFNPQSTDLAEEVARVTSGRLPGIVFECSGATDALGQAGRMVRPFGKIMQVGIYENNPELTPDQSKLMFQFRNASVRGSGGQQWGKAIHLMQTGAVRTENLVTHTFPLEDINKAFEVQSKPDQAIKTIVTI